MTRSEPVEWNDEQFDIRVGRQDRVSRCEMYEVFYRLCISDSYPLGDGEIAARGYAWRHLFGPDPDLAAIVDRLARRPLLTVERQRVLRIAESVQAARAGEVEAKAAVAEVYGRKHGLPLRSDFLLGTKLSLVLRVVRDNGL